MQQVKFTDPFTGLKFNAVITNRNEVECSNPITKEVYCFKIHGNAITVPLELFGYVDTVTIKEAAEILGVSIQRASKIARDDVVPSFRLGNQTYFLKRDILKYKEFRKVGAPIKE